MFRGRNHHSAGQSPCVADISPSAARSTAASDARAQRWPQLAGPGTARSESYAAAGAGRARGGGRSQSWSSGVPRTTTT